MDSNHGKIILGVLGLGVILVIIFVPTSMDTLEYYQMGFERSKTTATVKLDKVYTNGRYTIGVTKEFKKFQADAHTEYYSRISIFTQDSLTVYITATMQYFLRPHQLDELHDEFDLGYAEKIRSRAEAALKDHAQLYETRELIRERMTVEQGLTQAVRDAISGACCELGCQDTNSCIPGCKEYSTCDVGDWGTFADMRYFQLGVVEIPADLEQKYLDALVLQQNQLEEEYKQMASVERKVTEGMVADILNEAAEISQDATATSELLLTQAQANATAIREDARIDGLNTLYTELGFTTDEQKNSFDYLRTLGASEKVKLAVEFDHLVAGPLDKN